MTAHPRDTTERAWPPGPYRKLLDGIEKHFCSTESDQVLKVLYRVLKENMLFLRERCTSYHLLLCNIPIIRIGFSIF